MKAQKVEIKKKIKEPKGRNYLIRRKKKKRAMVAPDRDFEPDVNRTRNLLIWSQTRYHCATDPDVNYLAQ